MKPAWDDRGTTAPLCAILASIAPVGRRGRSKDRPSALLPERGWSTSDGDFK